MKVSVSAFVISALFALVACQGEPAPSCGEEPQQKEDTTVVVHPEVPLFEEEPDDPAADPKGLFDYSLIAASGHPRLVLDSLGFADLKAKVTTGRFTYKTLYKLHTLVLAQADNAIGESLKTASDHEIVVKHLIPLSYAYRLTGKEKYLNKAVADLTTVCNWSGWSSGLSTGEIGLSVAIAYDWLYYDLSKDLRIKAHKSLYTKCIQLAPSQGWQKYFGNWNSVCNSGAVLGAIAIYEKDKKKASSAIDVCMDYNTKSMKGIYYPSGIYLEGIGYWEYGTTSELFILSTLERIFGSTAGILEIPGFMDSGEFVSFMHGTMNTSFSFSDGGGNSDNCCLASWWYAAKKKDASLAWCEKHSLDAKAYESSNPRYLTLVPCVLKDFNIDSAGFSAPKKEVWSGDGEVPVAMVRHGWNYDRNDTYLAMKGGHCNSWATCGTSHAHMDAGSFVFEAEGTRWSEDIARPAYGPWNEAFKKYGSRSGDTSQGGLRWDTFRVSSLGHSTIVAYSNDGSVPGKIHPTDFYVDGIATIKEVIDSPSRQGAVIDMSAPMKGQVKSAIRTITLEGTDLVVKDEITALAGLDAPVEWRMWTRTSVAVASQGVTFTSNTDSSVKRFLSASSSTGAAVTYRSWPTKKPDSWNQNREMDQAISGRAIAGWTSTVPAGKTVSFTTKFTLIQ